MPPRPDAPTHSVGNSGAYDSPVTLAVAQPYAAVILAGGAARRLAGADKPSLLIGGSTMLDRVVEACSAANRVICVGPVRPTSRPVTWTREVPPGGGPVAALEAGIRLVTEQVALVFAADLPFIGSAAGVLQAAQARHDAAVLVDAAGRDQPLAGAYDVRALRAAFAALRTTTGVSMRTLLGLLHVVRVDDPGHAVPATYDCDTWTDVERARAMEGTLG
jgi:molybdopterin-guanine dinucleotide biosynthesis protein A